MKPTNCIDNVKSFFVSEADDYNLDKNALRILERDLIEFIRRSVGGSEEASAELKAHTTPKLANDSNYQAYLNQKDALKKKYLNQYVAYIDGSFVGADLNIGALRSKLDKSHPKKAAFIKRVTKQERVIHFRRPGRVIKGG